MPLYLMPHVVMGERSGPKYLAELARFGVASIRFGNNGHALVYAPAEQVVDARIEAYPDVQRLPDDLESRPSDLTIAQVGQFLERASIPSHWVSGGMRWREIARGILQMFLFAQRYEGECHGPPLFGGGITLESTVDSLPPEARQALQCAAECQGYDTSSLSGSNTLRHVLRALGQQWGDRPIFLGQIEV